MSIQSDHCEHAVLIVILQKGTRHWMGDSSNLTNRLWLARSMFARQPHFCQTSCCRGWINSLLGTILSSVISNIVSGTIKDMSRSLVGATREPPAIPGKANARDIGSLYTPTKFVDTVVRARSARNDIPDTNQRSLDTGRRK